MCRLACLALAVLVGGCSLVRADDALAGDTLRVGVQLDGSAITLTTERRYGCLALDVEARRTVAGLEIDVRGLFRDPLADCAPTATPAQASVRLLSSDALPLDVRIRHRGTTDRYRVLAGFAGYLLEAIETRVTRLDDTP